MSRCTKGLTVGTWSSLAFLIIFLFGKRLFYYNSVCETNYVQQKPIEQAPADSTLVKKNELLQKQRDELSSALVQMSKEYHQYQCTVGQHGIGSHGGWCTFEGHFTEKAMADALAGVFQGDTVASFGDGIGAYKKIIDASGKVKLYDSYDGAPFCENKTNGVVKYLDLTIPIYGLKMYDWILCLEVGEHVPKMYEQTLLDNVARHARKGIVLSWGVPNQPGRGHVNCQPLDYIVHQLDVRGFKHDKENSLALRQKSSNVNLKKNTNIYMRKVEHDADMQMI